MKNLSKQGFDSKIFIGCAIIIIGTILLLKNLGIHIDIDIWQYWPVILIIIGIGHLTRPKEFRQSTSGIILICIGTIILANNLDIIDLTFGDLFPIILILIGFAIVRHAIWGVKMKPSQTDTFNLSLIMGGGEYKFNSRKLKAGKITAIMGGGTIDLREADMEGETMVIECFAFWGGIDILVPKMWLVTIEGTPLMGGIDNITTTESKIVKKNLIVKGTAVMGGIEVKN